MSFDGNSTFALDNRTLRRQSLTSTILGVCRLLRQEHHISLRNDTLALTLLFHSTSSCAVSTQLRSRKRIDSSPAQMPSLMGLQIVEATIQAAITVSTRVPFHVVLYQEPRLSITEHIGPCWPTDTIPYRHHRRSNEEFSKSGWNNGKLAFPLSPEAAVKTQLPVASPYAIEEAFDSLKQTPEETNVTISVDHPYYDSPDSSKGSPARLAFPQSYETLATGFHSPLFSHTRHPGPWLALAIVVYAMQEDVWKILKGADRECDEASLAQSTYKIIHENADNIARLFVSWQDLWSGTSNVADIEDEISKMPSNTLLSTENIARPFVFWQDLWSGTSYITEIETFQKLARVQTKGKEKTRESTSCSLFNISPTRFSCCFCEAISNIANQCV